MKRAMRIGRAEMPPGQAAYPSNNIARRFEPPQKEPISSIYLFFSLSFFFPLFLLPLFDSVLDDRRAFPNGDFVMTIDLFNVFLFFTSPYKVEMNVVVKGHKRREKYRFSERKEKLFVILLGNCVQGLVKRFQQCKWAG